MLRLRRIVTGSFRRLLVLALVNSAGVTAVGSQEQPCRWPKRSLAVALAANLAGVPTADYETAVMTVLEEFESRTPLSFRVDERGQADIRIIWVDDSSDPRHPGSAASADPPPICQRYPGTESSFIVLSAVARHPETGRMVGRYRWSLEPGPTELDLISVLVHEFGHVLGLRHCDPACSPRAVMKSALSPGEVRRVLRPSDLAALDELYNGGPRKPGAAEPSRRNLSQDW